MTADKSSLQLQTALNAFVYKIAQKMMSLLFFLNLNAYDIRSNPNNTLTVIFINVLAL